MVEHDAAVGELLKKLEELGIADNTIVMYSTDNGAEAMSWPDGGTTIFRGEKNTNWEGGYRVPCLIRWPGVIKPGTVINDIGAHEDMVPTSAGGRRRHHRQGRPARRARRVGDTTYKVHLDGYNLMPALKGESAWPRHEFIYWTDDGNCRRPALRQLENHFPEAERPRSGRLAGALRGTARPHDQQSAQRSPGTRRV